MKALLVALLVAAVVAPAALATRAPFPSERAAIIRSLPAFYHQKCIRYTVKVSTVNTTYAVVTFRVVRPLTNCKVFDGYVVMRKVAVGRWRKISEGSDWPCKGVVPTRVVKDFSGGFCHP